MGNNQTNPVPLVNLNRQTAIHPQLDASIARVLDAGGFILSHEVASFQVGFPVCFTSNYSRRNLAPQLAPIYRKRMLRPQ